MSKGSAKAERVRRLVSEGAALLAARRPAEAATRLREACELDPNNVAAAINLGGAYILQRKYDPAIEVLESAARLEPENVMVWTNLAAAYLGSLPISSEGRQEQAIRAYERALSLDPATPHAHYNLGLIYLERKDAERARAQFRAALETDPGDRDARRYLDRLQAGEDGRAPA